MQLSTSSALTLARVMEAPAESRLPLRQWARRRRLRESCWEATLGFVATYTDASPVPGYRLEYSGPFDGGPATEPLPRQTFATGRLFDRK